MEYRINQRQKHTCYAFLLVPRRPHGSYMLQGESQYYFSCDFPSELQSLFQYHEATKKKRKKFVSIFKKIETKI